MTTEALVEVPATAPVLDAKFKAARNCCWTLCNYGKADIEAIAAWDCKYLIYGREKAEKTGTPHLQGYVEWKRPKEWKTLKNMHPRIHWESRQGSQEQAIKYCMKGEQTHAEWMAAAWNGPNYGKNADTTERGERNESGKRTDLEDVAKMVLAKAPIQEIASKHPTQYILYNKGIDRLIETQYKHRDAAPYIEWRWGPAGTGKTTEPAERHANAYYVKDGTMWWNGYTQQEAIIIDDFDGKWPFRDLLRLMDQTPYQGQTKGGYVAVNSPYIYITCEFPPSHWWGPNSINAGNTELGTQNALDQVMRRIQDHGKTVECTKDPSKAKTRRRAPAPKVGK